MAIQRLHDFDIRKSLLVLLVWRCLRSKPRPRYVDTALICLSVCDPVSTGKRLVEFSWHSVQKFFFLPKSNSSEFSADRCSDSHALLKRVNESPRRSTRCCLFSAKFGCRLQSLQELLDSMTLKRRHWNIVPTKLLNGSLAMNFWTLVSDTWTTNHKQHDVSCRNVSQTAHTESQ